MPGTHWTEEQISLLRAAVEAGLDPRDDEVFIPGKTKHAVVNQAIRRGWIPLRYEDRKEWSLAQRRRLAKAKREGFTPLQVFELNLLGSPRRSLWAIRKKWGRMKLSCKHRRRAGARRRLWGTREREEYLDYLRKYSLLLHPDQIAKHWGVKVSTVRNAQIALGVAPGRDFVMTMPYSKKKRSRSSHKAMCGRWKNWRVDKYQSLLDLVATLRESPRYKPENDRSCKTCGKSWPLHSAFFPATIKRYSNTTMTSRYFLRKCRWCHL